MFHEAPFHNDVSHGPEDVRAYWAQTSDNLRVRLAIWPSGDKGTILLLPGRTEYVEKYGIAATDFGEHGFAMASIDWRGQGLADRELKNPIRGHVKRFSDFQKDMAVLLEFAENQNLPKPYYLIGHSMGGSIGLRAMTNGLQVNAAAFTAPMWGISLSAILRPVAWVLSSVATYTGFGHLHTPGSHKEPYTLTAPFEDNMLTTDRDMFAYMKQQLKAYPGLALGSPSLQWLHEALVEVRKQSVIASPEIPTMTFLGERERIVDTGPIHERMRRWPNGTMTVVKNAEHEVLMEKPAIRQDIVNQIAAHFKAHP